MLTREEQRLLLKTARSAIESKIFHDPARVRHGFSSVEELYRHHPVLSELNGVFVTLKRKDAAFPAGALRGCIGTIIGREPLYDGVRRLAVESAFFDPRFNAVKKEELTKISIEISVLTIPKKIDTYHDIVIGRDGILLSCDGNSAVFLPQVATEQSWDLETTLTHLAIKAGLDVDSWLDDQCEFEVFQAEVFHEDKS